MKRIFPLALVLLMGTDTGRADPDSGTPETKNGVYAACFRMNIEAKNTYKRIVTNDKRSLTVSQEHRNGQLSVEEALSEAEQILKQQRLAYAHLANVLVSAGQLGCPDTPHHLGAVEMK